MINNHNSIFYLFDYMFLILPMTMIQYSMVTVIVSPLHLRVPSIPCSPHPT